MLPVLVAAAIAIPVYPGASLDAWLMKADRETNPANTYKIYETEDSFENVYTFYKNQKGASEEKNVLKGNTARAKHAVFNFKDGTVTITWPTPVLGKEGQVLKAAGTSLYIDTE